MTLRFRSGSNRGFDRWLVLCVAAFLLMPTIGVFVAGAFGAGAFGAEEVKKGVKVIVNKSGYRESIPEGVDFKDRLPRIKPMEPVRSLAGFAKIPGFRLELVAAEPLVCDPVDMAFDEDGRLWVMELIGYSERDKEFLGRVSMLEDTNSDGKFDKSTVLAKGLSWNAGIACYNGGVFASAAPDILYLKDTNGDGKADIREVVVTGFGMTNINQFVNTLRWRLDNRIHGVTAAGGASLRAVKWQQGGKDRKEETIRAGGRDFSFNPRTGELRLESGGDQHGMGLDAWGNKFVSNNSHPADMVMYEQRYIARNPYLAAPGAFIDIAAEGSNADVFRISPNEPWRVVRTELRLKGQFSGSAEGGRVSGFFTAACGIAIYTGNAWPEPYHGNLLVCEGAGNIVHRKRLEPSGVGFRAYRTEQGREFVASPEIWFRPVQLINAPDGNLYIADMYREIFEHPDAVPMAVKKYLDLNCGCDRGRVYRIVPEDFKQPKPVRMSKLSTVELVAVLEHANGWHRRTGARLLYERQDRSSIGPLVKLAAESSSPLGRMHAMHALDGLKSLSAEVVLGRLDDRHPRVREHAVRLAEKVLADSPSVRAKLCSMVDDEDLRVCYQLAFTLGDIPGTQATTALAAIAKRDTADRWFRLAVLSSSLGRAGELFYQLAGDTGWRTTKGGRQFLEQLAGQTGRQNRNDQVIEVFRVLDGLPKGEKRLAQAIVRGLSKGLTRAKSPLLARLSAGGNTLAGQLMAEMIAKAKLRAVDGELPAEKRAEAIRSLVPAPLEEVEDMLAELLQSQQSREVQMAVLETLGRHRSETVAEMVVEAWSGFSPNVQDAAAEALFARPERLAVLLGALEDETILPSQLDPARIEFLKKHPDKQIRAKADELLGGVKLARREEVVATYRDVLKIKGDRARGKAVFERECSTCHELDGVGYDLGLPLDAIQNRGPDAILEATLDPNREVQPQYLNYVVITDDGLSITGMIAAETATSVTLKRAEGESDTVLRVNIDEMQNTGLSIMPEGLEKQLPKQDMADLIAYLMSIK